LVERGLGRRNRGARGIQGGLGRGDGVRGRLNHRGQLRHLLLVLDELGRRVVVRLGRGRVLILYGLEGSGGAGHRLLRGRQFRGERSQRVGRLLGRGGQIGVTRCLRGGVGDGLRGDRFRAHDHFQRRGLVRGRGGGRGRLVHLGLGRVHGGL